jgi:hypothetical protein
MSSVVYLSIEDALIYCQRLTWNYSGHGIDKQQNINAMGLHIR